VPLHLRISTDDITCQPETNETSESATENSVFSWKRMLPICYR